MEKQKAQAIKPWEAAARAGVATVLAAGMAGTPWWRSPTGKRKTMAEFSR